MKPTSPSSQTVERLTFGFIVIVGYILVTWYGASGKAEAKEAGQIVHDAMLALGPLVGVIVYAIFKADKDATPGSVSIETGPTSDTPSVSVGQPADPPPNPTQRSVSLNG